MMKWLLLSLCLHAGAGPLVVGKGAGESEFALVFARAHLSELLAHCLGNRCGLDDDEEWVLRRMIHFAPLAPQAIFKTSQELGNRTFVVRKGEVWFNQDQLWQDAAHTKSYDEAYAATVWMDVLDEVLPDMVNVDFAQMKRLVRAGLSERIVRSHLTVGDDTMTALIYKGTLDRLYLRDAEFVGHDVSDALASVSLCEDGTQSQPRFHAVRWTSLVPTGERKTVTLEVTQTWACAKGAHRARVKLIAQSQPGLEDFVLDPKTVRAFAEEE